MAVVVRCSCPSSRPFSGGLSRRTSPFPAKTHSLHESTPLPFIKKRVAVFLSGESKTTKISSRKERFFSAIELVVYARRNVSRTAKTEDDCGIGGELPLVDRNGISEIEPNHQIRTPFSFPKAILMANAIMLVLPCEAWAETCEADNSLFNMPFLFGIALIGATVGGLLARQRKGELKRLNDQLRQINAALRRQAKIESYAPNLSYAPVGRMPETDVIVDPRKEQLLTNLKTGKNYLRNQEPEKAFEEFKAALELARNIGDHIEEKKAARGLGASLQRQGKYSEAIKYHSMVMKISQAMGEDSGNTEAYGAIADCYTELGDLERAGKFYDKYIARNLPVKNCSW